jgi:hypothetical protein
MNSATSLRTVNPVLPMKLFEKIFGDEGEDGVFGGADVVGEVVLVGVLWVL